VPGRRDLPKRASAHVLSGQSTKALQDALPAEWTVEARQHDYGVDFEVEIFEGGTTTGLLFSVQLKSTQAVAKKPSVRVRRATGNYWSSLDRPVLVVMFDAPTGRLLWQWWHRYDPYGTDTATATFSLKFPPGNVWDSTTTPDEIAREVRAWRAWASPDRHLPISVVLDRQAEVDPVIYGRVAASLRRRLSRLEGVLDLRATPAGDLVLSVEVGRDESVIWLSGGPSATLHHGELDLASDESVEQFTADLALLIASRLSLLRLDRHAGVLAARAAVESSAIWHGDFLHVTTWMILEGGLLAEAIDLTAFIVGGAPRDVSNAATIALMSWARAGDAGRRRRVADALASWPGDQEGDPERAAEFSYNAAQLIRRDDRGEALRLFDRAGDLDARYRARGYWWAERAGLLFLEGLYDDAVRAYEEAVARGERDARPLLADALLWARRFDDAAHLFDEVEADPVLSAAEWRLKSFVLTTFAGRFDEVDLLAPAALHDAAAAGDRSAEDRAALSVAAALAAEGAPELWMAAMQGTLRQPELLMDVAVTARRFCGGEIVNRAYELGEDPAFALAIQRLFEELPPEPPERNVLRYYDTEGGVTIFDLNEAPDEERG
jgi:tetratricopeptide (TPR) repeat protein